MLLLLLLVLAGAIPPSEVSAVKSLIERVAGQHFASRFRLSDKLAPTSVLDTFELTQENNQTITITGNSGVALASGFYHVFRWGGGSSVVWGANNSGVVNNLLATTWPQIPKGTKVRVEAKAPISFYMQPCTESYTGAFWDSDDWSSEVDWMALHGVNHPFVAVGVEAVWAKVLTGADALKSVCSFRFLTACCVISRCSLNLG
jgi:alpha-N-acetylglucosaminidase